MRFTLSSTVLNSRLQTLAKVINSKNSLAILESFLFQVHDGKMEVTASDSENLMRTIIPLDECDAEGKFAIPNRTVLDAVKELPEQPLTFEVNPETYEVAIEYQNGRYNFTAQDAEEYPQGTYWRRCQDADRQCQGVVREHQPHALRYRQQRHAR